MDLLHRARRHGVHFRVLVTEGRPHEAAVQVAKELVPAGIDTTIILDSAAAYHMDQCAAPASLAHIQRHIGGPRLAEALQHARACAALQLLCHPAGSARVAVRASLHTR